MKLQLWHVADQLTHRLHIPYAPICHHYDRALVNKILWSTEKLNHHKPHPPPR